MNLMGRIYLWVLGTSAMVPTKERNVSSYFFDYHGSGFLVDCGEGTQRQMNIAGLNRHRIKYILITHWHADHTAGLIGLLQTMDTIPYKKEIKIFGPKGTSEKINNLLSIFEANLNNLVLDIHDLDIPEDKVVKIYDEDRFSIFAAKMKHATECIAYSFVEKDYFRVKKKKLEELGLKPGPYVAMLKKGLEVEVNGKKLDPKELLEKVKGKKITFIIDTLFNDLAIDLAKNSNLVVIDSTYAKEHEVKASEYFHMTSEQAALIAKKARAKLLCLTHFSQRYEDLSILFEEAKKIFPKTLLGKDLMQIII